MITSMASVHEKVFMENFSFEPPVIASKEASATADEYAVYKWETGQSTCLFFARSTCVITKTATVCDCSGSSTFTTGESAAFTKWLNGARSLAAADAMKNAQEMASSQAMGTAQFQAMEMARNSALTRANHDRDQFSKLADSMKLKYSNEHNHIMVPDPTGRMSTWYIRMRYPE